MCLLGEPWAADGLLGAYEACVCLPVMSQRNSDINIFCEFPVCVLFALTAYDSAAGGETKLPTHFLSALFVSLCVCGCWRVSTCVHANGVQTSSAALEWFYCKPLNLKEKSEQHKVQRKLLIFDFRIVNLNTVVINGVAT